MSPEQCKIARTFLGWSQKTLAAQSGVSSPSIVKFEGGSEIKLALVNALEFAFSKAGISFGTTGVRTGLTRITLPDGSFVEHRVRS